MAKDGQDYDKERYETTYFTIPAEDSGITLTNPPRGQRSIRSILAESLIKEASGLEREASSKDNQNT